MEPKPSPNEPLNILMGSGVPKRREGGVAAIIYNLGRELEKLGHHLTYVFQEDLIEPGSVSPRWNELVFSLRLGRYIAENRKKFSIVNLHAPTGFPFRWSIRTADGAHTYSRDVAAMLQLKYNLDADRVAYIPNGVEPRFFISREYRPGETLRLLYAGTWLDQRGIFYIRDTLKRVAPQLPGLTMTFAGCGVPAEEIQNFFGAELAGRIAVRPVVAADRMQELYAEHDVFLFPSLMEGLPSVLLEAMATGMPVITTDTCGMPDVVEDEFNGLLIPPANAPAMEEVILRLARSVELRRSLGKAARETMKRYTWKRAGRQLEELYRHVLAREAAQV
jgi:glycosyltransferase involved in cell wall biosynthesis